MKKAQWVSQLVVLVDLSLVLIVLLLMVTSPPLFVSLFPGLDSGQYKRTS